MVDVVPTMVLVPAAVNWDVKWKLDVKLKYILYPVMVGHCGPYHDPGSRWSRRRCEVELRCKGIVHMFYTHS